jgi:hypothetical protein
MENRRSTDLELAGGLVRSDDQLVRAAVRAARVGFGFGVAEIAARGMRVAAWRAYGAIALGSTAADAPVSSCGAGEMSE